MNTYIVASQTSCDATVATAFANVERSVDVPEGKAIDYWTLNGQRVNTGAKIGEPEFKATNVAGVPGATLDAVLKDVAAPAPVKHTVIVSTKGGVIQNGEFAGQSGDVQLTLTEGANLSASLPTLNRLDYVFGGWYYENGKAVGATDTVTGNVSVFAKWTAAEVDPGMGVTTHTVTVSTKGGVIQNGEFKGESGDVQLTVGEGEKLSSVLPELKRDGYTFRGWHYTDTVAVGTSTAVGADDVVKGDVAVYATWDLADVDPGASVKTYTLTVSTNGGTIQDGEFKGESGDVQLTVGEGEKLSSVLPELKRDGFDFHGWHYADATGHGTSTAVGENDVISGDVAVYATWDLSVVDPGASVKTYTLTVSTNGGEIQNGEFKGQYGDVQYTVGENQNVLSVLPELKRDGYTFRGWHYADTKAHGTNTTVGKDDVFSADEHIVALWDAADVDPNMNVAQYTVVYNTNGGNIDGETGDFSLQLGKGETILDKLPTSSTLKRDGYKLAGWAYAETGTDKDGTAVKSTDTVSGDVYKLVAQWTKVVPAATLTPAQKAEAKKSETKQAEAKKAAAKQNTGATLSKTGSAVAGVAVFAVVALAGAAVVLQLRKRA
ncbi:InlB B-repeat-containing protein [Bifidobacterium saimiriisciurei]|uniref:InlB B-repeat-containing protein n=1 Tax=Bifidobacterium saimiriisciurei TaxID=2661627 RepID=UPI0013D21445|nr:InlB B-repeat-containing protein [Bifidobacterium saimiriisciurei]